MLRPFLNATVERLLYTEAQRLVGRADDLERLHLTIVPFDVYGSGLQHLLRMDELNNLAHTNLFHFTKTQQSVHMALLVSPTGERLGLSKIPGKFLNGFNTDNCNGYSVIVSEFDVRRAVGRYEIYVSD